jgi:hypothetical protein
VGHPDRSISCANLAVSLKSSFNQTGNEALLYEAIELEREALQLRPVGHPDRPIICVDLAVSLQICFNQTGDEALLNEAIELGREALQQRPVSHPDRSTSCFNLAGSLQTRFNRTGNEALLDEAIELEREAIQLLPLGHPDHSIARANLAVSLKTRFNRTGDETLLDEAIELNREALQLRPVGHLERSGSCVNLAASLSTRFNRTGDEALLDEAIKLDREALQLLPVGHPDRSTSCANLAVSLKKRFNRTGDEILLNEAIELEREALQLLPVGHPDRSASCANLAVSLQTRFNRTGDEALFDEAIELAREALQLLPVGHPDRSTPCGNLAGSLLICFNQTGDKALLNEAIELYREGLQLLPVGHPGRSNFCFNLSVSLRTQFDINRDSKSLDEAIGLSQESLQLHRVGHPYRWRALLFLAETYIMPMFQAADRDKALDYAKDALASDADNAPALLVTASGFLSLFNRLGMHERVEAQVLSLYNAVIDLALLVAGFLLDYTAQLQYLSDCAELGPCAYFVASSVGKADLGLQLLERARGTVWFQLLHLRVPDPLLHKVPDVPAQELGGLLHKLGIYRSVGFQPPVRDSKMSQPFLKERDVQHTEHTRLQRLIREIRSLPDLEDFMRGPTLQALLSTADTHPVVVLVANHDECQALIIRSMNTPLTSIALAGIHTSDLQDMIKNAIRSDAVHDFPTDDDDASRAMKAQQPRELLATLWHDIVKPVLDHLGLEVSHQKFSVLETTPNVLLEGCWEGSPPDSLVRDWTIIVRPVACCRHLPRRQSGVLYGLRGIIVHANPGSSSPRTDRSAASQRCQLDTPSGCSRR